MRVRQLRLRWLWVTLAYRSPTVWLCIGGRRPLSHPSYWRRRLLHLPSVRLRLWPLPVSVYVRYRGRRP